jgi:DNA mismatch repair protein MSH2
VEEQYKGVRVLHLCPSYADRLAEAHDEEHLTKFEELLEAAVDLDRIPDEYLICASYDADLQVLSCAWV